MPVAHDDAELITKAELRQPRRCKIVAVQRSLTRPDALAIQKCQDDVSRTSSETLNHYGAVKQLMIQRY